MKRKPKSCDRLCDICKFPMIGIMKQSGRKAPRQVCVECERKK